MTELTTTELAAQRARRFADVLAGYEAEGPDGSVPGASHDPARYAVITESSRGHGYFATYAATLADVETVAAANVGEGWWPVCYFDLDVLAGEEPILSEGDIVRYNGEERTVSHHDYEAEDGEPYPVVYLEGEGDDPWEGPLDPANEDMELVERAEPDERMPVRYLLAKITTVVAFNSRPEPAA